MGISSTTLIFNETAVASDASDAGLFVLDITRTGGVMAFQYVKTGTGKATLVVEQSMDASKMDYVAVQSKDLDQDSGIFTMTILAAPLVRFSLVGDGTNDVVITGMVSEIS